MSSPPSKWQWLNGAVAYAVHEAQLAEHGGASGVRDENLLASALARPQQLANYEGPDAAALAASYGFGIARNHPFVDGNKRTAFVAVELFLILNGFELIATDAACVLTMLDLASGALDEPSFASWIRQHLEEIPTSK
jgi:death-on-curing protein